MLGRHVLDSPGACHWSFGDGRWCPLVANTYASIWAFDIIGCVGKPACPRLVERRCDCRSFVTLGGPRKGFLGPLAAAAATWSWVSALGVGLLRSQNFIRPTFRDKIKVSASNQRLIRCGRRSSLATHPRCSSCTYIAARSLLVQHMAVPYIGHMTASVILLSQRPEPAPLAVPLPPPWRHSSFPSLYCFLALSPALDA